MKRISSKTREAAAFVCDVMASSPHIETFSEFDDEAVKLSVDAYVHCWCSNETHSPYGLEALAAQILREGWTP